MAKKKSQTDAWKPTAKQQRFIEEYPVDFNGTQAAIRAKYSKKTAGQQANRLLKNVHIQAAIAKQVTKLSNRAEVSAERVLTELSRLGFLDPRELFDEGGNIKPITDLPDHVAPAIASIEVVKNKDGDEVVKLRLWDKNRSLENLGRHLTLFKDSLDLNATHTIKKIEHVIVDPKGK